LSPLATLTSLQALDLTKNVSLRRFSPLIPLLSTLKHLVLWGCEFDDLPREVLGERWGQNVLGKVLSHFTDLASGEHLDAEIKVILLGNGGVGKSQLCRRLRGLDYDPAMPSTHGIQPSAMTFALEGFDNPVRLNLWDFGGQEVYHGSHALFLQGQAVFLILWTPKLEQGYDCEGGLTFRRRPLSYWLDYLRAFAGVDSPVMLIQSQCDSFKDDAPVPAIAVGDFPLLRHLKVSARTNRGFGTLTETLKEAVRDCFDRRPPSRIGAGRVGVRDRLRQLLHEDQKLPPEQRQHRLLERADFDRLCEEVGGISDKQALLDFLHHTGAVFYRAGLFRDRIVLDQNWALEAIYALFDRKRTLPLLRGYGRLSRADLEMLIWSGYTPEEQKVFLGMMESCGICFRLREISQGEWEYLVPELLPPWSDAQQQLLGRLREDPPAAEAKAHYTFLHEGVLRGYLSKIGRYAKDAAVYWKYGCWFYEKTTKSQVLIESQWEDATETGPGIIHFRAWGERADDLIESLLQTLQTLPVGQPPQITRCGSVRLSTHAVCASSATADLRFRVGQLEIATPAELPDKGQAEVYVSYAWGDDSSEPARQRTEVVDRLCQKLAQEGWNVLRDKDAMRPGELISGFMKRIGRADRVIVVLSSKYLQSTYCMTELHAIYQRSLEEKEDFLQRIIPLTLQDARIGTRDDRLAYAQHWKRAFQSLDADFADPERRDLLGEGDFAEYRAMRQWYTRLSDMLRYINDVLHPHGFEAIVKDDFAALRQMLHRERSERRS
jgi:internalin A